MLNPLVALNKSQQVISTTANIINPLNKLAIATNTIGIAINTHEFTLIDFMLLGVLKR